MTDQKELKEGLETISGGSDPLKSPFIGSPYHIGCRYYAEVSSLDPDENGPACSAPNDVKGTLPFCADCRARNK